MKYLSQYNSLLFWATLYIRVLCNLVFGGRIGSWLACCAVSLRHKSHWRQYFTLFFFLQYGPRPHACVLRNWPYHCSVAYTLCLKKRPPFYFCDNFVRCRSIFTITGWLIGKFAIKFALNIPPHLTNVATLPCEILMSENNDNLKHV